MGVDFSLHNNFANSGSFVKVFVPCMSCIIVKNILTPSPNLIIYYDYIIIITGQHVNGQDVTKLASMGKLKAGRLAREIADSCLQYWGGMGFTSDVLISRLFR